MISHRTSATVRPWPAAVSGSRVTSSPASRLSRGSLRFGQRRFHPVPPLPRPQRPAAERPRADGPQRRRQEQNRGCGSAPRAASGRRFSAAVYPHPAKFTTWQLRKSLRRCKVSRRGQGRRWVELALWRRRCRSQSRAGSMAARGGRGSGSARRPPPEPSRPSTGMTRPVAVDAAPGNRLEALIAAPRLMGGGGVRYEHWTKQRAVLTGSTKCPLRGSKFVICATCYRAS